MHISQVAITSVFRLYMKPGSKMHMTIHMHNQRNTKTYHSAHNLYTYLAEYKTTKKVMGSPTAEF